MERKLIIFFVFWVWIFCVIGGCFVSATNFGVSIPYNEERPLTVYPGEVKDVQVGLRVRSDEESLVVRAEFLDNAGIASLVDDSLAYSLFSKEPVFVNVKLTVPENAIVGSEYAIMLRFTDIAHSEDKGMVGLRTGAVISLKANVVEKPEELAEVNVGIMVLLLALIVLILVIIVVIWFVVKKREKKKNRE